MSSGLPVRIQVRKAVARALQLEGTLDLSRLTRLQGFLLGQQGDAYAQVEFARGLDGYDCLRGHVTGELTLQCQRCLGEVPHQLDVDFDIRLIAESGTDEDFEGIEIPDDELMLHEAIEDEMILALPTVAMHEDAEHCEQGKAPQEYLGQEQSDESNPFAVLAKLKSNTPSTR